MIRLLQVVPSLEYADPQQQMTLLCERLPAAGFDVRVFSLAGRGPLAGELAQRGVPVLPPPERRHATVRTFGWLRQAIAQFSPHLVHTWSNAGTGNANLLGAAAATLAGGRPVVVSERSLFRPSSWPRRLTDRLLIRRACCCVVNSPLIRDLCIEAGWKADRMALIPNGVCRNTHDPAHARQLLLNELQLPAGARLIGTLGPLEPRKRLKDLIWATDQLNMVRDDCYLLIVGQGAHRWRLERYRDQVVTRKRVFFLGPRRDVPQFLAGLDCLWTGSQAESVPNSVLEAMAAGIPVIASDIAAHRALVMPGETGYLVRVGNRPGYARQTLAVLRDESFRRRCEQASRPYVDQHFDVEAMVRRHVELYHSLRSA